MAGPTMAVRPKNPPTKKTGKTLKREEKQSEKRRRKIVVEGEKPKKE